MRKANKGGQIQRYLKKRYEAAKAEAEEEIEESLAEWAAQAPTYGEVLTAAINLRGTGSASTASGSSSTCPFAPPEVELVPDHKKCQALVRLHPHCAEQWHDPEWIRADLELHAFREHHVKNILAMLAANGSMIDKYADGTLDKKDDEGFQLDWTTGGARDLVEDQLQIVRTVVGRAEAALAERKEQEEWWRGKDDGEEQGEDVAEDRAQPSPFSAPQQHRRAMAVLGPAGSGKITAVEVSLEEVVEKGGPVIVVAPTGRLVASFRQKYPHLDVETIQGAFQTWKPIQETWDLMNPYDLINVEEVEQLSQEMFERLIRLWEGAGRLPALVFVGDFPQLPGVDGTRATHSPSWHNGCVQKLELRTMHPCKCKRLRAVLEILRTAKPSVQQLRRILRGHKTPSASRGYVDYRMQPEPTLQKRLHTQCSSLSQGGLRQIERHGCGAPLRGPDSPCVPPDGSRIQCGQQPSFSPGPRGPAASSHLRRLACDPHQGPQQEHQLREWDGSDRPWPRP